MKSKTKFLKWFRQAPQKTRSELVINYWETRPYSLNIVALEVKNDTDMGKKMLKELGWDDD